MLGDAGLGNLNEMDGLLEWTNIGINNQGEVWYSPDLTRLNPYYRFLGLSYCMYSRYLFNRIIVKTKYILD